MQWHDVQQNTEVWDALRLGKVTASQFNCFMANQGKTFGEPARRYALQIALEIITGKNQNLVSLMTTCYADTNRSQSPEGYTKKQTLLMSLTADFLIAVIMAIVQTD